MVKIREQAAVRRGEDYREESERDGDLKRLLDKDASDDGGLGDDVLGGGLLPGVQPVPVKPPHPVQRDVEPRVEPVHGDRYERAQ